MKQKPAQQQPGIEGADCSAFLAALLAAAPMGAPDGPAVLTLPAGTRINGFWGALNAAVARAGKYAAPDLSACEADYGMVMGSPSPSGNDMNVIRDNAYITGILLPGVLTVIGRWAFAGCAALRRAVIPASVTGINDRAFSGCARLPAVTIPAGTRYIGAWAFDGCAALERVTFAPGCGLASGFGPRAFPEGPDGAGGDALKAAYEAGGAGTYTRGRGGAVWVRQEDPPAA